LPVEVERLNTVAEDADEGSARCSNRQTCPRADPSLRQQLTRAKPADRRIPAGNLLLLAVQRGDVETGLLEREREATEREHGAVEGVRRPVETVSAKTTARRPGRSARPAGACRRRQKRAFAESLGVLRHP